MNAPSRIGGELPFIYNVMNFAKPVKGEPALLSRDVCRQLDGVDPEVALSARFERLPSELSSFVGREREVSLASDLLRATRLDPVKALRYQ